MSMAYCMKCKDMVDVVDGEETVTKNNLRCLKGECANCGTRVSKILGKAELEDDGGDDLE